MVAKLVYLASPYSHVDPQVVEARFIAVCRAAGHLMSLGAHVFCPIAHSHPIFKEGLAPGDWEFWRDQDIDLLDRCDEMAVLQLDGWQESVGVTAEIQHAVDTHKHITFYSPASLMVEDVNAALC